MFETDCLWSKKKSKRNKTVRHKSKRCQTVIGSFERPFIFYINQCASGDFHHRVNREKKRGSHNEVKETDNDVERDSTVIIICLTDTKKLVVLFILSGIWCRVWNFVDFIAFFKNVFMKIPSDYTKRDKDKELQCEEICYWFGCCTIDKEGTLQNGQQSWKFKGTCEMIYQLIFLKIPFGWFLGRLVRSRLRDRLLCSRPIQSVRLSWSLCLSDRLPGRENRSPNSIDVICE